MTKELWINLPVKDLARSKQFYKAIGFTIHPSQEHNTEMTGMVVGEKKIMVMLVPVPTFEGFIGTKMADTSQGTQVLFSIDAESREEVNEIARKAKEAGGTVFGEPAESQGWMYGCGFSDPDGHRWNVLFMDMSKLPQQ
jgi:uncharacterized protein